MPISNSSFDTAPRSRRRSVVKSRLLDVERSLETTPEENCSWPGIPSSTARKRLRFSLISNTPWTQISAAVRTEPSDADFSKRSLDYFRQLTEQCVRQKVSRIVICDTLAAPA